MMRRLLVSVLFLAIVQFFMVSNVHAAPVVGFDPSLIIDNGTLTNSGSMSVSDIQNFFNIKVPVCDTNGQQLSEYGGTDLNGDGKVQRWEYGQEKYGQTTFTCLKDYSEGGKSAAQIIYDTAQQYKVNPQVLIVLLQKEQGLVTDTWPLNLQYRTATGYGCPDTSACDSQYYGFTNQVKWAATLFHSVMTQSPTWFSPYVVGNNYIAYNPQASCGGSTVNIQNLATAALYDYTPYQPNQAALNAGWNAGDSCSSYGNRNFYLYFNEWFGGWLINTVDTGNLYIRGANGTYYQISTYAQLQALGISYLKTYNTTSGYLANLTSAGQLGSAVMFNSLGDIYSIDSGGLKYYNASTYHAYGDPTVSNLAAGLDGGVIPRRSDMTTVLAANGSGNLYGVSLGQKHYLSFFAYNNYGYNSTATTQMSQYFLNNLPSGYPILQPGSIVKASDTGNYYVINADRTSKTPLDPIFAASLKLGLYTDTSAVLNNLTTTSGITIGMFAKDSSGNLYILDAAGMGKILVSSTVLSSIGKTNADFVLVDNTFLDKFSTETANPSTLLVYVGVDGKVYRVDNKELVWIQSGGDFTKLGYIFGQVVTISTDTAARLFTNNNRSLLLPGTFYAGGDGAVWLLDGSTIGHRVPTADLFTGDFARSWGDVRQVSTTTKSFYTTGAALSDIVKDSSGNKWLISNDKKYSLTTAMSAQYDPGNTALTIDPSILSTIPSSVAATQFIRINDDARVYYIQNGTKYPLGSVDAFTSRGGTDWSMVISVSPSAADTFPTGNILY